jgi:hypothetical protein
MRLPEMVALAQQGVKMTHRYFSENEWLVMQGNLVVFEDGVKIFLSEWITNKEWLNDGWSKFEEL